ncbi:hypothetical protein MKP08_09060 [Erythrobacter sp. LQ02-29]|uniref:hypothetical protein n=1 Tax=Erythrobacter sp. LQ02-29 TaxID=2920384 RepID=UPI001F4EBD57|nr:hypothetical protein [Erythrobacter sp. LQ02-29]MCP9222894.1 hypothetical protein [Erythrobacter sp. LQ02-29]
MAYGITHSIRGLALACAAIALPSAALAQDVSADPTDSLPDVEAASLRDAATTCAAASDGSAVDIARFIGTGWSELALTDGDGAALPIPVTFLQRGDGDPLVIVPQSQDEAPVCVSMGVLSAGDAGKEAVKAAFTDAFGAGETAGEEADEDGASADQTIYRQGANMIVLTFEDDDEQGLVALAVVVQPGE